MLSRLPPKSTDDHDKNQVHHGTIIFLFKSHNHDDDSTKLLISQWCMMHDPLQTALYFVIKTRMILQIDNYGNSWQ